MKAMFRAATLFCTAILTLSVSLAVPAAAAPVPLADLSAYLNGIKTAESPFVQTNADGSKSSGRVVIQRPNRMRLEYAKPDKTLVLASGASVAVFDPKSNQPPDQYPLRKTPLNLILADRIDLSRARMVVDHGEQDGMTTVTAQDPEHPEYGTIKLFFSASPVALRQWIVTDGAGAKTRVVLSDLVMGKRYDATLFSISIANSQRNER